MCLILFLGGCQAKKRKEKKCLIKNEFNSALYFSFRANVPSKSHFCIVFLKKNYIPRFHNTTSFLIPLTKSNHP